MVNATPLDDEVFAMGRPALPHEIRRRFWREIRTGVVLHDAASVAGVSKAVAWRWFREAGGAMPDVFVPAPGTVPRLSFVEREEISCRHAASEGVPTDRPGAGPFPRDDQPRAVARGGSPQERVPGIGGPGGRGPAVPPAQGGCRRGTTGYVTMSSSSCSSSTAPSRSAVA